MDKDKLVDLAAFRERNGLKQEELAQLLGVNRSYISQVETGSCRISADKMKKLWEVVNTKPWFWDDLVPAHARLVTIWHEIHTIYYPIIPFHTSTSQAESRESYREYRDNLVKHFEKDFSQVVPESVRERIRLGQQGIDTILAERIISILPPDYKIEKDWLLSGELPMHPEDVIIVEDPEVFESYENKGPSKPGEARFNNLLEMLLKQQEELKKMIIEVKELLLNKA